MAERNWEIIFIDDDSPDGTAEFVRGLAQSKSYVRCHQQRKMQYLCRLKWFTQDLVGLVVVSLSQGHFGAPASKRARRLPLPSMSSRWFPKIFHDLTYSNTPMKSRSVSIPSRQAMKVIARFPSVS